MTPMEMKFIADTLHTLSSKKYPLQSEKILQRELAKDLLGFTPEFQLHKDIGVIDFHHAEYKIGIEVKIGGSRRETYFQCKRYCVSPDISALILVTNRSMGLPAIVLGKPCYVINLWKAWL